MTFIAMGMIALVVLLLLAAGVIVGYVFGSNDDTIDVLAKRLAAEQRIEAATRETLRAMRLAVRTHRK